MHHGMGLGVESSCGPELWFPLCFGSSLGLGEWLASRG